MDGGPFSPEKKGPDRYRGAPGDYLRPPVAGPRRLADDDFELALDRGLSLRRSPRAAI